VTGDKQQVRLVSSGPLLISSQTLPSESQHKLPFVALICIYKYWPTCGRILLAIVGEGLSRRSQDKPTADTASRCSLAMPSVLRSDHVSAASCHGRQTRTATMVMMMVMMMMMMMMMSPRPQGKATHGPCPKSRLLTFRAPSTCSGVNLALGCARMSVMPASPPRSASVPISAAMAICRHCRLCPAFQCSVWQSRPGGGNGRGKSAERETRVWNGSGEPTAGHAARQGPVSFAPVDAQPCVCATQSFGVHHWRLDRSMLGDGSPQ
jgi:hypothetical protein